MPARIRLDRLKRLPHQSEAEQEKRLTAVQHRLERIQHAFLFSGDRAIILFEGMDAAGKGGAIRRIAWALDPRSLKVWPIGAPNAIEARQHYLQRFWARLPARGEIAVFDRSWYGRVLVERVEGFAKPAEWRRAYDEILDFEAQLLDDGFRLVKIFLHVSRAEQMRRFEDRLNNPLKRWKLTYEDFRNREKWPDYVKAIHDMFDRTSSRRAPWHVIQSDDKPAARVAALSAIADIIGKGIDLSLPELDPRLRKLVRRELGSK